MDSIEMDEDQIPPAPFARACIRGERVTLNPWNPRMIRGGPMAMQIRKVRASLVDLVMVSDDELIANPVAHSRFTEEDARAITTWAKRVGYSRIWLPERVVELDGEPAGGTAKVLCRSCGARWEDQSHGFWLRVRDQGHFPGYCPACGGSLPEWDVADPDPAEREPVSVTEQVQIEFSQGMNFGCDGLEPGNG